MKREILAKNYRDRQAARPQSAHGDNAVPLSSSKLLAREAQHRKISPQQALSGARPAPTQRPRLGLRTSSARSHHDQLYELSKVKRREAETRRLAKEREDE